MIKSKIGIFTKLISIIWIMQIIIIIAHRFHLFFLVCLWCLVFFIFYDLDTKNQNSEAASSPSSTLCMNSSASALLPFQALSQTVKMALWVAARCGMRTLWRWDGPVICNEGWWHISGHHLFNITILFWRIILITCIIQIIRIIYIYQKASSVSSV